MKILLIEDERSHCEEYTKCSAYLPYTVELSVLYSSTGAIDVIKDIEPDVILLDLELHNSENDGMLFLSELKNSDLEVVPYVIIITHNTSKKTLKTARICGADYIFSKAKPDYSPHLVFDFAYNYYRCQPEKSLLSKPEKTIEAKINVEMDKIGITNGMSGRNYIIEAILIICSLYSSNTNVGNINLKNQVYSVLAKKYKKSLGSIEQGIKNAIQKAWLINDIDTLVENYTATINFHTGYPMNKDFIFYYVDKFKDELR